MVDEALQLSSQLLPAEGVAEDGAAAVLGAVTPRLRAVRLHGGRQLNIA